MKLTRIILLFTLCLSSVVFSQKKSLRTNTVHYLSGVDTVQAYFCRPDTKGPYPAVILIHEWWGLTEWMKENAKSFAMRGYATLAIDLYRGKVTELPDEAKGLSEGLPQDRVLRDVQAAFRYMTSQKEVNPAKIGVIGWCMGGGYALLSSVHIPDLAACVICYGRLVKDSSSIASIQCPVLGIFGDADKVVEPNEVRRFEHDARLMGKNVRMKIYPNARHAFMNPNNEALYSSRPAEDAWKNIFGFIDTTLSK